MTTGPLCTCGFMSRLSPLIRHSPHCATSLPSRVAALEKAVAELLHGKPAVEDASLAPNGAA